MSYYKEITLALVYVASSKHESQKNIFVSLLNIFVTLTHIENDNRTGHHEHHDPHWLTFQ